MIPDLINVRVRDNIHMSFVSVRKSDIIRQVFENANIDVTNGVFSVNSASISDKLLDKTFEEVLLSIKWVDFSKPIYLTKVDKSSVKVMFTLKQIDELKYIIENSGINDAIEYIDEIANSQFEDYKYGRL